MARKITKSVIESWYTSGQKSKRKPVAGLFGALARGKKAHRDNSRGGKSLGKYRGW